MLIGDKLNSKENLSEIEQGIALFIMEKGRTLDSFSIRNLAEATFTSPATIIRFCKKLGYKGFDDFKTQFIKEVQYLEQQYGEIDVNFPFSKDDNIMKVANKISQLYEDTVHDTLSLFKYSAIQKAITLIKNTDNIYIFSAGTALNQAESFREKMLKIGKHVSISNNLNYQLYEVGCLTNKDIAILISYSGETEKIIQVARECKNRAVPIIAITSFGENTLSQFGTCKLVISTKENIFCNIGDFSTHLSINLILDILYANFFLQDYENNYQRKLKKVKNLEKLRKSTNSIISNNDNE